MNIEQSSKVFAKDVDFNKFLQNDIFSEVNFYKVDPPELRLKNFENPWSEELVGHDLDTFRLRPSEIQVPIFVDKDLVSEDEKLVAISDAFYTALERLKEQYNQKLEDLYNQYKNSSDRCYKPPVTTLLFVKGYKSDFLKVTKYSEEKYELSMEFASVIYSGEVELV